MYGLRDGPFDGISPAVQRHSRGVARFHRAEKLGRQMDFKHLAVQRLKCHDRKPRDRKRSGLQLNRKDARRFRSPDHGVAEPLICLREAGACGAKRFSRLIPEELDLPELDFARRFVAIQPLKLLHIGFRVAEPDRGGLHVRVGLLADRADIRVIEHRDHIASLHEIPFLMRNGSDISGKAGRHREEAGRGNGSRKLSRSACFHHGADRFHLERLSLFIRRGASRLIGASGEDERYREKRSEKSGFHDASPIFSTRMR